MYRLCFKTCDAYATALVDAAKGVLDVGSLNTSRLLLMQCGIASKVQMDGNITNNDLVRLWNSTIKSSVH
jgi:hypothetical protein